MWESEAQNSTGTLLESRVWLWPARPPAETQGGAQGSSGAAPRSSQKSVGMERNRKCTLSLALPSWTPFLDQSRRQDSILALSPSLRSWESCGLTQDAGPGSGSQTQRRSWEPERRRHILGAGLLVTGLAESGGQHVPLQRQRV